MILSAILAVLAGGIAWLALGTRLPLATEPRANELLNVLALAAIAFPIVLVAMFAWVT